MKKATIIFLSLGLLFFSCSDSVTKVSIKNNLNFDRTDETVMVKMSQLDITDVNEFETLGVVDSESNEVLLSQKIDTDGDGNGNVDVMIFQPKVKANSTSTFKIIPIEAEEVESKVYSRFVPERTDDYTWENDRVAFRTFGPTAQKMIEEGTPGGTLTSGIDCWLKSVDYPIINKWYKAATIEPNYYHVDRGEGFDPYHVGGSRGCGGIGVFENEVLYVSKNFAAYKTITNGPIRTCFNLDYEDWNAGDKVVKEQKHISLDLGNNLMRIITKVEGVDEISVGITLHENSGKISIDTVNNCFSYWEQIADSELGTGVVVAPGYYSGYTIVNSDEPDKSHLLIHLKVIDGKVKYYSGFGWKKSGQFESADDWNSYLKQFYNRINNPLNINLVK